LIKFDHIFVWKLAVQN